MTEQALSMDGSPIELSVIVPVFNGSGWIGRCLQHLTDEGPGCGRVFLDVSKNGSRRFCSVTCQNRVKAAAFRQRRGAASQT